MIYLKFYVEQKPLIAQNHKQVMFVAGEESSKAEILHCLRFEDSPPTKIDGWGFFPPLDNGLGINASIIDA